VRHESAALAARFEDVGRELDHQLLDEIFHSHGLTRVVPSADFQHELEAALLEGRGKLDAKLVSPALVTKTVRALAPK
jgi:hypothetical protein